MTYMDVYIFIHVLSDIYLSSHKYWRNSICHGISTLVYFELIAATLHGPLPYQTRETKCMGRYQDQGAKITMINTRIKPE